MIEIQKTIVHKTQKVIFCILLIVSALFTSCLNDDEPSDKQKTVTVYVAAKTRQAITGFGGTEHECMLVKEKGDNTWSPYDFGAITGFTYEKGYEYELLVTKTIYANPPADGGSYDYTLIKVVSKVAVNH